MSQASYPGLPNDEWFNEVADSILKNWREYRMQDRDYPLDDMIDGILENRADELEFNYGDWEQVREKVVAVIDRKWVHL